MINLILYIENKNYISKDVKIINMALAKYNVDYRIYTFNNWNEDFETIINNDLIKIYVLDINSGGKGISVAREIRKREIDSSIILITDCNKYQHALFDNRLMVLDFICKNNDYEERLCDDIIYALRIVYERKSFIFKYNHIVYRIPYRNINYIEKEPEIKRCIIHTVNGNYYVVNSIQRLSEILSICFCKVHQSCIVNIGNIKKVCLNDNIIIFNNGDYTQLFSDKYKYDLMKMLNIKD